MAKVTIELEDEQIDAIILKELKWGIDKMEEDLEHRANGVGMCVFDNDPVKDIQYINQYISAFKLIYDYYGGEVD